MNAFDSWLKSMAESSKTCDTVITESTKKIKRHRLGKLSEDEQGMIKYRRLLDKWVNKEQDDDYVETDDDGNETVREPGDIHYYLKGFKMFEIKTTEYNLVFNGKLIHPEKILEGKNIKSELMSSDAWSVSCQSAKFERMPYSVGKMIDQLFYSDEDKGCGIDKVQNILTDLFEMMKRYDISGIESFVKQNKIEVDDKTGTIRIPSEAMDDTIFDIIISPNPLSV